LFDPFQLGILGVVFPHFGLFWLMKLPVHRSFEVGRLFLGPFLVLLIVKRGKVFEHLAAILCSVRTGPLDCSASQFSLFVKIRK